MYFQCYIMIFQFWRYHYDSLKCWNCGNEKKNFHIDAQLTLICDPNVFRWYYPITSKQKKRISWQFDDNKTLKNETNIFVYTQKWYAFFRRLYLSVVSEWKLRCPGSFLWSSKTFMWSSKTFLMIHQLTDEFWNSLSRLCTN